MHSETRRFFAHKTAEIAATAIVGDGCKIWNDCQIREGAVIGSGCILGKGVYIDAGVRVGNNCKIQNYACLYHGVTVEDDVFIGPGTMFTNDRFPRSFNESWEVTPTHVEKGASIGANSTVRCGANIGTYSMIGAGSVVTRDVHAFTMVVGNPARKIGDIDVQGRRLAKR